MDDIRIILSKAAQISPYHRKVPNLSVEARVSVDEELSSGSERDALAFYGSQARSLVQAFSRTLPGGLIDAILVALLEHRCSIFQVPYSSEPSQPSPL